mmetsp:Transcript_87510/g.120573  ORF Transcript_87510/g.120573 Transcript_87510/m.120573 type:complete len:258 (-) Transcript_87510:75-848(-)
MENQVESDKLMELRVSETQLISKVGTVVHVRVTSNHITGSVFVVVDQSSNSGHLRAKIQSIFHSRLPVLSLVDTIVVSLDEVTIRLASQNTSRELSHSVHVLGERTDKGFLVSRQFTSLVHLFLEHLNLTLSGELTGEEQPKNTLGNGLTAIDGLRSLLSDGVEIVTSVEDTVHSIKLGGFIEHTWEASHTTNDLVHSHFTDGLGTEFFLEVFDFTLSLSNEVFHLLGKDLSREVSLSSCLKKGSCGVCLHSGRASL